MTPVYHPYLINSPFEDPCLFVDVLHSRYAILLDLGTLTRLPPRKILRLSHIFVSHTHIDHFIGFDHLIRLCLGRDKRLHLFGPPGFVHQVGSRLASYTWNLVYNYDTDFTLIVTEVHPEGRGLSAEFHCLAGFRKDAVVSCVFTGNILLDGPDFLVRAELLDHKTTSLAFSLEEKIHINIMKNRLDEMNLAVGPWLKELKQAVLRGDAADNLILALPLGGTKGEMRAVPLGELSERVVSMVAGQKICYVTDAGFTPGNREKIISLAAGADYLFIEAAFLDAEAARAAERHHLTARQAGELARRAGAARAVPFHFSPKYKGRESEIRDEFEKALKGGADDRSPDP